MKNNPQWTKKSKTLHKSKLLLSVCIMTLSYCSAVTAISDQPLVPGSADPVRVWWLVMLSKQTGHHTTLCIDKFFNCRTFTHVSTWFKVWEDVSVGVQRWAHHSFVFGLERAQLGVPQRRMCCECSRGGKSQEHFYWKLATQRAFENSGCVDLQLRVWGNSWL